MAAKYCASVLKNIYPIASSHCQSRLLHVSPVVCTVKAGRIKPTVKKNKPVTYEDALPPNHIGARKSWNSWNTSTIEGNLRPGDTAIEDTFIRKFFFGTFPNCLLSKPVIKRQHNIIRIASIMTDNIEVSRMIFLIGYTEELLSHWLHCNVKLEVQIVFDKRKMIFKYV